MSRGSRPVLRSPGSSRSLVWSTQIPVASLVQKLNAIRDLNVLHLRAGYFMENNLAAIGMIQGLGIFGGALLPALKLPMIATRDVGDYAAQRLLELDFSGRQTRELLGERDLSMTDVTAVIARGIGKSDLRYEQFPYQQVQQVLTQMGVPPNGAASYIEMYKAINTGVLIPLEPRSPFSSLSSPRKRRAPTIWTIRGWLQAPPCPPASPRPPRRPKPSPTRRPKRCAGS